MKAAVLMTRGNLGESAKRVCWPAQYELEQKLRSCLAAHGIRLKRAFPVKGHGFHSSKRMGMDIFAGIDPDANLVFATAPCGIAYAPSPQQAAQALAVKAAMLEGFGIKVHICGSLPLS